MAGTRWTNLVITYGFAENTAVYGANYPTNYNFLGTFSAMSAQQRDAVSKILDADYDDGAYSAFSFEGITGQNVAFTTSSNPHIRGANADAAPFGYGFFPQSGSPSAGDFWIGDDNPGGSYDTQNPIVGNYSFALHMHEIGHALGLHHPHHGHDSLDVAYDSIEFTLMSYRSYVGGPFHYAGPGNEFPQSFMTLDIQALQHLYGANFNLNSGDTVYSWTPGSGDTVIDGQVAIDASINKIFATIWDGGGTDTYDLSAYALDLNIDLSPGEVSSFAWYQTANLGHGNTAAGNIYNAHLYQGDQRSLIENAIGGSGDDILSGNAADNRLDGGAGNDTLTGKAGVDTFVFTVGGGQDQITDFEAGDVIELGLDPYTTMAELLGMITDFTGYSIIDLGGGASIRVEGWQITDFSENNFRLTGNTVDGSGPFRRGYVELGIDKGGNNAETPKDDVPVVYEEFSVIETPTLIPIPAPSPYENLVNDFIDFHLEWDGWYFDFAL